MELTSTKTHFTLSKGIFYLEGSRNQHKLTQMFLGLEFSSEVPLVIQVLFSDIPK